jgi:hypothetical protein
MPTFRLSDDHLEVSLSSPSWRGGLTVKPGGTVTDLGELITSRPAPKIDPETGEPIGPIPEPLPEDAYLVLGRDGTEKAWPKALWELQPEKTAAKPSDDSAAAPKGK